MRRWRRIALWVLALLPSVILALFSAWYLADILADPPFLRKLQKLREASLGVGKICSVLDIRRDSPSVHGGYYFDDMAGLAKRAQGFGGVHTEDTAT